VSGAERVEGGERLVEQQGIGEAARARAIATRCCCPPESSCGRRCAILESDGGEVLAGVRAGGDP
jgi:hypothetical protein